MTIHFPTRAALRLDGARALIDAANDASCSYVDMAHACERAARELNKAAGDLRRAARQERKSGAAGAVHDTRKQPGEHHDTSG